MNLFLRKGPSWNRVVFEINTGKALLISAADFLAVDDFFYFILGFKQIEFDGYRIMPYNSRPYLGRIDFSYR